MKFKKLLPLLAVAVLPLAACGEDEGPVSDPNLHTLNTFLSVSPSNWNELTYQDNNDTEIMGYIGGGFFGFDFEFDDNHNIVPGGFRTTYQAVRAIEDITAELGAQNKFGLTSANTKNRAFRMTLRDDLKWDDGTPIFAKDFVYTMKQQLDPTYQNYRADSYYNSSTVIHNAKGYNKQGQSGFFAAGDVFDTVEGNEDNIILYVGPATSGASDYTSASCSVRDYFKQAAGMPNDYALDKTISFLVNNQIASDADVLTSMQGKTLTQIKADPTMKAIYDELVEWWAEGPDGILAYCVANYTFPVVNFNDVGLYAEDNYNLVIALDKSLEILDENGDLTYHAAYEFGSLPLVKEDLFEKCRVPADTNVAGALPTYRYNTSVETSASWGPYKLSYFQAGKQYILDRNPYWYGYNMNDNYGLYETDRIVVDIIEEGATAWQLFLNGDLDSIAISPALGNVDYKTSSRAFFTASDFVASMQLQSDVDSLSEREKDKAGVDKEILSYVEFRKALSLCIDRNEYASKTTTASKAGFGIFNSMHYYDVANAGVYRDTSYAKKTICDVYGVTDYTDANLDAKYASVTGTNKELAKQLFTEAYNKALADGKISATDKVVLTIGTSVINESTQLQADTLTSYFVEGVKGTPLEGRLETELVDHGDKWAGDFRDGGYDICTGGWSGAAWDPGYFLLAYLSPDYMYSTAWDTSAVELTFRPEGANEDYTMSLMDWYDCLNGLSETGPDWSDGMVETEFRLSIIAALEKEILKVYYTVPLYNSFSASLLYNKVDYITRDYNTFMSYGGIKYMHFNYTDGEWAEVKGNQDYRN